MVRSDCTVTQLTPGSAPAVHKYYDVPVEEPPGGQGRILYFRFDRDEIPGPGTVVVAAADGSQPIEIGRGEEAIGHVGAMQCWVAPGKVAWSPRQQSEGTSLIADLDSGRTTPLESNVRSFCEATGEAVVMGGGGSRLRPGGT